jgi:oligopeptide/dipeptide ABC transporter ATP-binding protein
MSTTENRTPAASEPLLVVDDLHLGILTGRGTVRAVDGVSLTLDQGRTLGVVGESGSGKTMLAKSIMGLVPQNAERTGSVRIDGEETIGRSRKQMRSVWGRELSMVPQDPMTSLNPVRRVGDQITEPLRHHLGLDRKTAKAKAIELLQSVRIPDPDKRMREYPHQLSGGMRQRVVIAAALACSPGLLFADEPTTALDVTVQAQILNLLTRIQTEREMAMVLVTHDLGVVAGHTDEIIVMYAGQVVEKAPTTVLFERMHMPYTQALLASIPTLDEPVHTRLAVIPGRPPDLVDIPKGCRFAARCEYAQPKCVAEPPPLFAADTPRHEYRCWFPVDGPKVRVPAAAPTTEEA